MEGNLDMLMYQGKSSTAAVVVVVDERKDVVELEDETTTTRQKKEQDVEIVLQTPVADVDSLDHSFGLGRLRAGDGKCVG